MEIAILIFDGMTAIDVVRPYEVLSRLPDSEVRLVASSIGPKRSDVGSLGLVAFFGVADPCHAPEAIRALATTGLKRPRRDRGGLNLCAT